MTRQERLLERSDAIKGTIGMTQAAKIAQVTTRTIRVWCDKGLLEPCRRIGPMNERRFYASEVIVFTEKHFAA